MRADGRGARRTLWARASCLALTAATAAALAPAGQVAAATSTPNDPFFVHGEQWALTGAPASIHAPAAWCVSTGTGVLVADVDTGVDFSHPDLAGKLVAGAAFLGGTTKYGAAPSRSGDPSAVADDSQDGHGTQTTGVMAADTDNGTGIAAVAPGARALVVKVLDSNGQGYDVDIANGILWSAQRGARVINVSIEPGKSIIGLVGSLLGGSSMIPQAVDTAFNAYHAVVVLAAGNQNGSSGAWTGLPAGEYLQVGAVGPDGSIASYSNRGTGLLYAPGGTATDPSQVAAPNAIQQNIVSTTRGGGYAISSGTSFAAPQVSGAAALLAATGMGPGSIIGRLMSTATTGAEGQPDLDAGRALNASGSCGGTTAAPASRPRPTAGAARQAPSPASPAGTPPATRAAASPSATPDAVAAVLPAAGAPPTPLAAAPSATRSAGPGGAGPDRLVAAALASVSLGVLAGVALPVLRRLRRRRHRPATG